MMRRETQLRLLLSLLSLLLQSDGGGAAVDPGFNGYDCSATRSVYPCQAYAFYRAGAEPGLLDLASIGDLFGVSRHMIARSSNLSTSSTLYAAQPLLVPLTCSCSLNRSFAAISYQINGGDTYYRVSTINYLNLTTYQAVELVNPTLVATNLDIGVDVVFPLFCKCPNASSSRVLGLVTYVFQPSDNYSSIASSFGSDVSSLVSLNGREDAIKPYSTVFVPISRIPPPILLMQSPSTEPAPLPEPPETAATVEERKGVIVGLAIGLGVMGFLWVMLLGVVAWWGLGRRRRRKAEVGKGGTNKRGVQSSWMASDGNLVVDIAEWLDKYRVYRIEELRAATSDFDHSCLIQGSVYKGWVDGEAYAIKKMKWNACEELKILQKVNHTNLVKLEGFCIDPEVGTCYLVYEYVENGSLHSWLHSSTNSRKLDWRTRLRIALDLANGLQYIHEHTWPRVVHKDIKSSNVLLDGKMRAKIANFGLAKTGCNAVTTHIVGTQGYIAPEYLADGLVTTKMDVFAYGVVLLELISGKEATNEEGDSLWMDVDNIFERRDVRIEGRLMAWMDSALVEHSCPMDSVISVMNIARACLQRDPAKRPTMVDVTYTLSKADELYSDFSGDGLTASSDDVLAR